MSKLDLFIARWLIRRIVTQDEIHRQRITQLYATIREAAQREFYEDNDATLNAFLQECFDGQPA